jgi:tRNA pseudouridine32 synthase / 23S rRNA pseudouridine746 synthase
MTDESEILQPIALFAPEPDGDRVTYQYQGTCPQTGQIITLPRTLFAEKIARRLMSELPENREGKMYGILLVKTPAGNTGYLQAFSGLLDGQPRVARWVPPLPGREQLIDEENEVLSRLDAIKCEIIALETISDRASYCELHTEFARRIQSLTHLHQAYQQQRQQCRETGNLTAEELENLNEISRREGIERRNLKRERERVLQPLRENIEESDRRVVALKQQRKALSRQLQELLYRSYCLSNFSGHSLSLRSLMGDHLLPTGTGECCAPKLLHYAASRGWTPLALAEFWWGRSHRGKVAGEFYGACVERCQPLMGFLLSGLQPSVEIIYEDDSLIAVHKAIDLLSVPGRYRHTSDSVLTRLRARGKEVMAVHRLDLETSGILVFAKDKHSYRDLARQFENRQVYKVYEALLSGQVPEKQGSIDLPLSADRSDRPRQILDLEQGKPSLTRFQVIGQEKSYPRVEFFPLTGRTHQIRVHCQRGLKVPILGDRLYGGEESDRLYLHARELSFSHPQTEKKITLHIPTPF